MAACGEAETAEVCRKCEIIIMGGGIAGLSAASHLVKCGHTDFLLLEATDKLGGRVDAVNIGNDLFDFSQLGNTKLELGANWIHGVLGNPIYEIAMTHGLIDIMHYPKPHKVIAAAENGEHVPFAVLQEIYQAYLCFLRRCEEYFLCQYLPPEGINSVGEHIRLEIELYLKNIDNPEDRKIRQLIFECLLKRESCITGCDNMNEIDLLELGSYTELQGGNIQLPGGYSSILEPVTSIIPPKNIILNSPVVTVNWQPDSSTAGGTLSSPGYDSGIEVHGNCEAENDSDDSDRTMTEGASTCSQQNSSNRSSAEKSMPSLPSSQPAAPPTARSEANSRVEVTCENGSKFVASHVICCVPLGVLKENATSIFVPKLPQYKFDSIRNLAFGTVDKIFMVYSRSFLHPEVSEVMLLWNDEAESSPIQENWFKKIYSFAKVSDTVVLGWVSGAAAEYMETLPEAEVAEKCTHVLRKFLNDPYIPLPKQCVFTKWKNRKFSRGSYTSIAVGASQLDIEQIAQPLYTRVDDQKPVLLFAGEHTHSNFYSTVHGAYLSGRCAAQMLLRADPTEEVAVSCNDTSDLSSWIQGIDLT